MRKDAREIGFKLVFEYFFNNKYNQDLMVELATNGEYKIGEGEMQMINNIYDGVIGHYDEFKAVLEEKATGYTFDRIYKTDVAILMVAMYEISYCEDVPNAVAVNEAIELAKKYGSEKSPSFINGILATYIK